MTPVIKNPYQSAQYVLWGLVGLFAIPVVIGVVMVMRGTWPGSVLILISMPFLLFCCMGVITWGRGKWRSGRLRLFSQVIGPCCVGPIRRRNGRRYRIADGPKIKKTGSFSWVG